MKSSFTTDELFTLGLFSYMDAMLDRKMDDILKNISFSDKIKNALLGKDKKFRKILKITITFEQGDWENIFFSRISGTHMEKKLPEFYLDSIRMADSLLV